MITIEGVFLGGGDYDYKLLGSIKKIFLLTDK
jgi:hypothetical protein